MRRTLEQAGRRTTSDAPLAWVEMESRAGPAEVALTAWPGGQHQVVALAGLNGNPVKWSDLTAILFQHTHGWAVTPCIVHDVILERGSSS